MLLVTGATGNVGKAVLAQLASEPVAVRAFVRDPAKLSQIPANVEVVQGDLNDEAALKRALAGVDVAFLASSFNPSMAELHSRFVTAAGMSGVRRIVQLSGIGANTGICCSRALRWLGLMEKTAAASKISVTHLRPTFLMQNLLRFAKSVAQEGVIAGPFRSAKWTFVDARDVGAVAATALLNDAHADKTYVVTSSESITYSEVAERLTRVWGKPIRYLDITSNEARGRLQASGVDPVMVEATLELWDVCASKLINVDPTSVVQDVTGRAPRTIEDFAQDYRAKFVGG